MWLAPGKLPHGAFQEIRPYLVHSVETVVALPTLTGCSQPTSRAVQGGVARISQEFDAARNVYLDVDANGIVRGILVGTMSSRSSSRT